MNESAACVRRAVLVVKIFLYMGQDQSVSPRLDQSLLADQHSDPKTPSPKQAVTYISLQYTLLTFRFGVRPDTLLNWMDGSISPFDTYIRAVRQRLIVDIVGRM